MVIKKISIVLLSLLAFACSDKQEIYTVDYLYEHEDVRNQILEACKSNQQVQENCDNASLAKAKRFNETSEDKQVQQW